MQGHSKTFTGFCRCHHFDLTVARAVFFFFFLEKKKKSFTPVHKLNISSTWQLKSSNVQAWEHFYPFITKLASWKSYNDRVGGIILELLSCPRERGEGLLKCMWKVKKSRCVGKVTADAAAWILPHFHLWNMHVRFSCNVPQAPAPLHIIQIQPHAIWCRDGRYFRSDQAWGIW